MHFWSIRNEFICFNDFVIISLINKECNQLRTTIWAISCASLAWIIPLIHAIRMENMITMGLDQVTNSCLIFDTGLNADWTIHTRKLYQKSRVQFRDEICFWVLNCWLLLYKCSRFLFEDQFQHFPTVFFEFH